MHHSLWETPDATERKWPLSMSATHRVLPIKYLVLWGEYLDSYFQNKLTQQDRHLNTVEELSKDSEDSFWLSASLD